MAVRWSGVQDSAQGELPRQHIQPDTSTYRTVHHEHFLRTYAKCRSIRDLQTHAAVNSPRNGGGLLTRLPTMGTAVASLTLHRSQPRQQQRDGTDEREGLLRGQEEDEAQERRQEEGGQQAG